MNSQKNMSTNSNLNSRSPKAQNNFSQDLSSKNYQSGGTSNRKSTAGVTDAERIKSTSDQTRSTNAKQHR